MLPSRSSPRKKLVARRSQIMSKIVENRKRGQTTYAPFDTIPDELVLKIIKMSVIVDYRHTDDIHYNHYRLTQVIAKISTRFQRIVATKSLWTGDIKLTLSTDKDQSMKELEVLHDEVQWLQLQLEDVGGCVTGDHLKTVAERCPNLETFRLDHDGMKMGAWPRFDIPWMALEELRLFSVEFCNENVFNNVSEFHRYFPNLDTLEILHCKHRDGWEPI